MKLTTKDLENQKFGAQEKDDMINRRAEFMFNYLDYNSDRTRVREKFMKEMHKKTTLEDIGRLLDDFIIDEKAASPEFWDPSKSDGIKTGTKDTDSFEMTWLGKMYKNADPLKPLLIDDDTPLENTGEGADAAYRDIIERIKHEDARRDHSY